MPRTIKINNGNNLLRVGRGKKAALQHLKGRPVLTKIARIFHQNVFVESSTEKPEVENPCPRIQNLHHILGSNQVARASIIAITSNQHTRSLP